MCVCVKDQEFETGVRLIRDAYMKKLAQREAEIVALKGDQARKDAQINELSMKVQQLEQQLSKSDKKISEMTRHMSKLSHFKQSVMNSFQDDDNDTNGHSYSKKLATSSHSISANAGGLNNNTRVSGDGSPSKHSSIADLYSSSTLRPHTAQGNTANYNQSSYPQANRTTISSMSHHHHNATAAAANQTTIIQDDYNSILRESLIGSNNNNNGRLQNNDMSIIEHAVPLDLNDDDDEQSVAAMGASLNRMTGSREQVDYDDEIRRVKQQIRTNSATNSYQPQQSRSDQPVSQKPLFKQQQSQSQGQAAVPQQTASTATTTTVDGREYFRKAKAILSYDEFSELLWNVKSYNNRQQSRAKTLENVFAAIGGKHGDMFGEFEKLLSS